MKTTYGVHVVSVCGFELVADHHFAAHVVARQTVPLIETHVCVHLFPAGLSLLAKGEQKQHVTSFNPTHEQPKKKKP